MADEFADLEARIEALLTEVVGAHGTWVLAVETFTPDLDAELTVRMDESSSTWKHLGLAHALVQVADSDLRAAWEAD